MMENSHQLVNGEHSSDTEVKGEVDVETFKLAEDIVSKAISGATQYLSNDEEKNANENHNSASETADESSTNSDPLEGSAGSADEIVETNEKPVIDDQQKETLHSVDETTSQQTETSENKHGENETNEAKEKGRKDEWMLILGHEKLKKKVLRKGEGARPKQGQEVTINYSAKLENDSVVESVKDLRFTLGDQDVIHAFDLCICLMDEGEICLLVSHPQYAYGELGSEPDIPSNAWLNFEIELVKVDEEVDHAALPLSQKISIAEKKRERGNYVYARGDYSTAINVYNRTIRILEAGSENQDGDTGELQRVLDIKIKSYNNLAASQLKVEAWDAAIRSCDAVLKFQPENVKALFRKGKCQQGKEDIEEAIKTLRKAVSIDPDSKIVQQELTRLMNKQKKEEQSTKDMYQRMLGTDKYLAKKRQMEESAAKKSSWSWYVGGAVAAAVVSAGFAAYRYLHL